MTINEHVKKPIKQNKQTDDIWFQRRGLGCSSVSPTDQPRAHPPPPLRHSGGGWLFVPYMILDTFSWYSCLSKKPILRWNPTGWRSSPLRWRAVSGFSWTSSAVSHQGMFIAWEYRPTWHLQLGPSDMAQHCFFRMVHYQWIGITFDKDMRVVEKENMVTATPFKTENWV